jgi:hypothetical protein
MDGSGPPKQKLKFLDTALYTLAVGVGIRWMGVLFCWLADRRRKAALLLAQPAE